MKKLLLATTLSLFAAATVQAQSDLPFDIEPVTSFDEAWALVFLPDGRMLVTEKKGNLFFVTQEGQKSNFIDGVPDVAYGGQGGLGDVVLHPDYSDNRMIYLSFA
ncbi:MAG: PQQ-dependent sugar dehydrogenase, partial [Gammaproteobacteria bacterium]